ncbi:hypothetical protein, partial [Aeromonas allosaccharophila]|uniref:hypothetical protein n=1 Tax=Aeromonas allosaccharophila TaxID=656 RepID=UPI003D257BB8
KIAKKGTFLVIHIQPQLLYKLIHRNRLRIAKMAENKEAKMDLRLRLNRPQFPRHLTALK